jgi:hypothetical protein
LGIKDPLPWKQHGIRPEETGTNDCNARVEVTEDIREWDCKLFRYLGHYFYPIRIMSQGCVIWHL